MNTSGVEWRGTFCMEVVPVPNIITIFGASGDLAHRKLLPALFSLHRRGLLHKSSKIIGCARTEMSAEAYRNSIREVLKSSCTDVETLDSFLKKVSYINGDYQDVELYRRIGEEIERVSSAPDSCCKDITGHIFYFAVPPELYALIASRLGEAHLTDESEDGVPCRNVVLEKPFGRDLKSAAALDSVLHRTLRERQLYRIDHYLGKETVQNMMVLRFANRIFEPVWNSQHVASVQITAAETLGVGHRAGYFDRAGLLRDMFQNHLLELLALSAMEIPRSTAPDDVRDEKLKLIKSIRPVSSKNIGENIVRAQYTAGNTGGTQCPGYREEDGIPPDSGTETFVAMRLFIDNWRWNGVPFFLRSGKRMAKKSTSIIINFKPVPHSIFSPVRTVDLAPNRLILNIQPEEGFSLSIEAKEPGPKLCMGELAMDFKYASILEDGENMPDAYERLLLDCMLGDQTLFIRGDTIEYAWSLLSPVLEAWENNSPASGKLHFYQAGSWGPKEADKLLFPHNSFWRNM